MKISFLLVSFFFLSLTPCHADLLTAQEVYKNNKGILFNPTEELQEGTLIYIYSKQEDSFKLQGMAKIESCSLESCKAIIKKIRKQITLSEQYIFSTDNLSIQSKGKKNTYGLASLGGPLAYGYNLGFYRDWKNKLRYGGRVGYLATEIGKVNVRGQYFSGLLERELFSFWGLELNPYGELGYLKTRLDFSKVAGVGPIKNENTPFIGAGLNLWKLWEIFFSKLRVVTQ